MLALQGIRVVDLSQVLAGPFATMLLADLGAEVIKVENPSGGDLSRHMAPAIDEQTSGAFLMVNRNKRSVSVDLKSTDGLDLVRRLVSTADVFVENFRTGVAERLGLGYDAVRATNPRLVYCSISGFGQTGPYSARGGFDLVAQGMTGLMSVTGEPGGNPVKCGIPITDIGTGVFAAYGILGALMARQHTGSGQRVEASLFETGIGMSVWEAAQYFHTGETPAPTGSAHRLSAPYQAFRCADGHVTVGADGARHWPVFCRLIDRADLVEDPRFATNEARLAHLPELVHAVEAAMTVHDRAHWLAEFERAGIPAGPINSVPEALDDEHTRHRGMVVSVPHARLGDQPVIGPVVKLSDTPATVRSGPPDLGADTTDVLADLAYSPEQIMDLRDRGVVR